MKVSRVGGGDEIIGGRTRSFRRSTRVLREFSAQYTRSACTRCTVYLYSYVLILPVLVASCVTRLYSLLHAYVCTRYYMHTFVLAAPCFGAFTLRVQFYCVSTILSFLAPPTLTPNPNPPPLNPRSYIQVPPDSDRRARSTEDMAKEALHLRSLFKS